MYVREDEADTGRIFLVGRISGRQGGSERVQPFHDGSHCVAAHFLSGDGGIGTADLGKEHPQVVVDHGGGYAGDALDRRLGHSPEELAGKGGKALGETALPLCEEGVEGEGCLAGAADTCDDGQAVARYVDIDALEVVGLGIFNVDVSFFRLFHVLFLF